MTWIPALLLAAAQVAALPPRDTTGPAPAGTGIIRGRVVAAPSGQPLRRAQVQLNAPAGVNRRTTTDANGRFEFTGLPAASFSLSATRPGYVGLTYGARRPQEPGTPIVLADRQVVDKVDFALPRGGVIAVRVTDEFGEPVIGAQVQVQRYQYTPEGQRRLMSMGGGPGGSFTDDRGEHRAFGLTAGEYVVSATLRMPTAGPALNQDPSEGFAPTFYPGVASADLAQTVSVAVGDEATVQFSLVPARLARISGVVVDSRGRPLGRANVQIAARQGNGLSSAGGGQVANDGTFSIGGVAPGDYVIQVRPMPRPGEQRAATAEFASVPIAVAGADISGLQIVTGPGTTITGRVVFEGGARPATPNPVRVMLQQSDAAAGVFLGTPGPNQAGNGALGADDRFQITGAGGRVFFNVGASGWLLKSVMVEGRNVTDEPLDLAGVASVSDVLITMTNRPATLSGQVLDSRGQVETRYVVVVVPMDAVDQATVGRLTRTFRAAPSTGRFQTGGMRPGRYAAVALESLENGLQFSPEFQEQVRRGGQQFSVREGENVTLDLKLATP